MRFFSRLPVVATLVTLLAVVIMIALGVWQLKRAEQKTQRLASIELATESAVLDLVKAQNMAESALDMPVKFAGHADSQHYFLIDNKTYQGQVGYALLVPVLSQNMVVMVNWGWLAAPALRSNLPAITIDASVQDYQGMLAIPRNNSMVTETASIDQHWPKVLQQVDLALISQLYGQSVLPFVIQLDEQPTSGFVRHWQPVVMPPEKHIAYAVQWFLLATAALGIFVIAQSRKNNRGMK